MLQGFGLGRRGPLCWCSQSRRCRTTSRSKMTRCWRHREGRERTAWPRSLLKARTSAGDFESLLKGPTLIAYSAPIRSRRSEGRRGFRQGQRQARCPRRRHGHDHAERGCESRRLRPCRRWTNCARKLLGLIQAPATTHRSASAQRRQAKLARVFAAYAKTGRSGLRPVPQLFIKTGSNRTIRNYKNG